jgi:hypothetical protein
MEIQKDKLPDAKGTKVAQKTQKKPRKSRLDLTTPFVLFAQLVWPLPAVNGIFLRLLRNFCALCVRYFCFEFRWKEFNWVLTPINSRSAS